MPLHTCHVTQIPRSLCGKTDCFCLIDSGASCLPHGLDTECSSVSWEGGGAFPTCRYRLSTRRDKPAVQTPALGAAPAPQRSPTQRPLVTLPSSLCRPSFAGHPFGFLAALLLASVAALGRHLWGLLSVGNALQTCVACLSGPGSSGLPCVLSPLTDPRRVVAFSVSSACHLLLGWRGDFQAPYMRNPKPEVNNFL